jgi:hypothetical protein
VYKLDSFVGFIGDEQLHAQECYVSELVFSSITLHLQQHFHFNLDKI